MTFDIRILAALLVSFSTPLIALAQQDAIAADPPQDKAHPATIETFQIPSHGSPMNALMYIAAGAGPHGTVILLHGFPGNEKNLDVAQTIRRDGWNVLYFNYRGSWGTPGAFSFTHCMEDAQSALAYLRNADNASKLRVDSNRIVLMGHSMGGMIAAYTAAHDPKILGLGIFSAADMAGHALVPPDASAAARAQIKAANAQALGAEGLAPLSGCTPEGLAEDLMAHPEYSLARAAEGLKAMPVLIVTSDDGGAGPAEKLSQTLLAAGNQEAKYVHFATDHSFSDKRIALQQSLLDGLDYLDKR